MHLQSKAWVCDSSFVETVGSNPAGAWMTCYVRSKSPRLANHSSRGLLPSILCLTECYRSLDNEEALAH